ncbi:MAG: Isoquinoline 1-oxidoreductase subunit [Pseudorhodoplanes sp.]
MRIALAALGVGCIVATAITLAAPSIGQPRTTNDRETLRPVSSFDNIRDTGTRSVALFTEAGKVLSHPRCVNCHPRGDSPLQTDQSRPHQPLVVRGPDGMGAIGMQCGTCHHSANFDPARVPGDPQWHLAPREMAWEGKTLGEICRQIKDPARNGGKDLAAIVHHSAEDHMVGWGWNPGPGRTPAPGTQKEFGALIKAWVDTGAACPG